MIRLKRKQRHCLKCGSSFTAIGPFNRICRRCKRHREPGTLRVHNLTLPWNEWYFDR